jgi:hypothetical protein
MLRVHIFLCCIIVAHAFVLRTSRQTSCTLLAKNKVNDLPSKGFKKQSSLVEKNGLGVTGDIVSADPATIEEDEEIDADAIFKKYKISDGESLPTYSKKKTTKKSTAVYDENAPFGRDTISSIPFATQQKIDNVLVTSVFIALTFVIICGIAISFGAFKVVYPDIQISNEMDEIITGFLTPAFTPALGIFFLCSITFGLFKFAQISNTQTVYKE